MLGSVNVLLQYNKKYFTTAQCSRLSQLLIAEELSSSRRYSSSRPSILVQYWNNSNYCQEQELRTTVQSGTLDKCQGRYLEQQWIYAYRYHQCSHILQCPLTKTSSMSIVHTKPFPISKLINTKVDHSMLSNKHNSAATNVSDVERDEYCNKAP